jgi:50S ribosomal protein L16 3-hydroxylase
LYSRVPTEERRHRPRYNRPMQRALLGGGTAVRFLHRYWQKRPLLIRQAIPAFRGMLSWSELAELATRDDVESRLVVRERSRWTLTHGPFRRRDLRDLPLRNWTLLVQGVNLHVAEADALLRRFSFIPHARLDDLMVSYAAPGGGVGAHFDSYDVFLLQGEGRRRWRIGRQRDLALKPGLPLKILSRFRPRHECVLAPGDMLYLPPDVAHDGAALDTCSTYSIGFRAPSAQELATGFLDWLRDRLALDGRYRDPGLAPAIEPARIGRDLRRYAVQVLSELRWDERAVGRFLGTYLTEPKPSVAFTPPRRPLARSVFAAHAARGGLRLDSATQLLYDRSQLFINGEAVAPPARARVTLRRLANTRGLPRGHFEREALQLLYRWYRDGFLHLR